MTSTAAPDLLGTIVAATRRIVDVRKAARSEAVLRREPARTPDGRAFEDALRGKAADAGVRIIAECKRRSPSKGILRSDYDPAAHARAYASAGAAAISVLTEPTFFDGSLEHLRAVRAAVSIPVLRKDFVISEYQLLEAVVFGADAVLLIVGALDDRDLRGLLEASERLGLAALVEVHDRDELRRAVQAGARIIGVNSRNLRTLSVEPAVFDDLAAAIPRGVVAIAESGIRTSADLDRLSRIGYHAFLVGERLIAKPDPGAALQELRRR